MLFLRICAKGKHSNRGLSWRDSLWSGLAQDPFHAESPNLGAPQSLPLQIFCFPQFTVWQVPWLTLMVLLLSGNIMVLAHSFLHNAWLRGVPPWGSLRRGYCPFLNMYWLPCTRETLESCWGIFSGLLVGCSKCWIQVKMENLRLRGSQMTGSRSPLHTRDLMHDSLEDQRCFGQNGSVSGPWSMWAKTNLLFCMVGLVFSQTRVFA